MLTSIIRLAVVAGFVCLVPRLDAQDLKAGVTRLADVDRDYYVQGEYYGPVTFCDGYCRPVGLQVVALGDGKFSALWYPGGLPGNGYDGSARWMLAGQRTGSGIELTGEGLNVDLSTARTAIVRNSQGVIGRLQMMLRSSSTEGAIPPSNAIVLFDGKNIDRLKNARVTSDGLLEIGAETREPVGNFTLHAEFVLPYKPFGRGQDRGNSGFYLQKRYEVQVLDSFGLELQKNDCASLYKFKAPDLNMCFPPLRWQTYDIDFTAPQFDPSGKRVAKGRITVRHNGVLVHNCVELENKTGGGSPEGPNPLPILLQNHGNQVRFRNLWLVDHGVNPVVSAASSTAVAATTECCVPDVRRRHGSIRRRR